MEIVQILQSRMDIFGYIIGDEESKQCALVDPAFDTEKILKMAHDKGYTVTHILNTHCHSDHTAGNAAIKHATGASICIHKEDGKQLPGLITKKSSPSPDRLLNDKEIIHVGKLAIQAIHTPGHTQGGVVFHVENNLFTGDTLFVGAVGRCDLPGGSMKNLKQSIRKKLYTLPDDTIVWPGHHYGPTPTSTIGHEKKTNVVGP